MTMSPADAAMLVAAAAGVHEQDCVQRCRILTLSSRGKRELRDLHKQQ